MIPKPWSVDHDAWTMVCGTMVQRSLSAGQCPSIMVRGPWSRDHGPRTMLQECPRTPARGSWSADHGPTTHTWLDIVLQCVGEVAGLWSLRVFVLLVRGEKNVYGSGSALVAGNWGGASACASGVRVGNGLRSSWPEVGYFGFLLSCLEAPGAHMFCMGVESGCAPQRSRLYSVFRGFVSLCFSLCVLWPLYLGDETNMLLLL